jgi:hypothetical protein
MLAVRHYRREDSIQVQRTHSSLVRADGADSIHISCRKVVLAPKSVSVLFRAAAYNRTVLEINEHVQH